MAGGAPLQWRDLRCGEQRRATGVARPQHDLHSALRKKRPVMPCGSSRSRTTAATSNATSPSTEVKAKVATTLMAPSSDEAMAVPDRIAAPPLITVMKALAI